MSYLGDRYVQTNYFITNIKKEPRLWFWADVITISSLFHLSKVWQENISLFNDLTHDICPSPLCAHRGIRVITFSLGKCFSSSFKLLNGSVWYHNLALTERFLANICDGASGHLRSATLVTVCRVLREAPEREGGLLHGETACSAGLQSLSACCSIQGTHSHLYLWAPVGEVVVPIVVGIFSRRHTALLSAPPWYWSSSSWDEELLSSSGCGGASNTRSRCGLQKAMGSPFWQSSPNKSSFSWIVSLPTHRSPWSD